MIGIYWRRIHQWGISTKDEITNNFYLLKMNSPIIAIYWRWTHQWLLSTEDEFTNDCNLLKMNSPMIAIYWRWIHQWLLICYLLKMNSPMIAIYWSWIHQWIAIYWRWIYQLLVSTEDEFTSLKDMKYMRFLRSRSSCTKIRAFPFRTQWAWNYLYGPKFVVSALDR